MKKRYLIIVILIISMIGFTSGTYFKFIKSYSEDKLQVEKTNLAGQKTQRQLKLGEMISMLNELNTIVDEYKIESDENHAALKRLKTINLGSIIIMILSSLAFIWSIQKLRK